jgi:hypothetical protein
VQKRIKVFWFFFSKKNILASFFLIGPFDLTSSVKSKGNVISPLAPQVGFARLTSTS